MMNSNHINYSTSNSGKELENTIQQLEDGVKELFESEKYKNYLTTMSKFHNYSANNILLITMQNPDASYVAGYKAWKKNFNRNVKPGEKGITILAPAPYEKEVEREVIDPATNKVIYDNAGQPVMEKVTITIPAYRTTKVFDISQTYGKPLPTLVNELNNDVSHYKEFVEVLQEVSPVPIEFKPIKKANGYYSVNYKYIAVKDSLPEEHSLKTIIHEMGHAILHSGDTPEQIPDAATREVQAESVAYIVCHHFGIDTSEYSFGYVAGWSEGKDLKELKSSLSVIQKTSNQLINNIEEKLKERNLIHIAERKKNSQCQQNNKKNILSR